jgi:RecJ-like exonuclease
MAQEDCDECAGTGECIFCDGSGTEDDGLRCDTCDGSGVCQRCDSTEKKTIDDEEVVEEVKEEDEEESE